MIAQRMMVGGGAEMETWQFTVNTEATAAGEKKTGIPFNLYGQDSVVLTVDWGDGTTNRLTSADYLGLGYTINNSYASMHEYTVPGVYNIAVLMHSPSEAYVERAGSAVAIGGCLDLFKKTLVSLDNAIPAIKGNRFYNSSNNTTFLKDNSIYCLFYECQKLHSINGLVFDKMKSLIDASYVFVGCSSITSIPDTLFAGNNELETLESAFSSCSSLGDVVLHITSPIVNSCTDVISPKKEETTRTIYVPSGSTTETTFNAVASNLGLTIIGE